MKGIQHINFDLDIKVQRNSSGRIVSGLVVGDILHQNQALILTISKGELKTDPSVGVGLQSQILNHDTLALRREIRQQLEMDGQKVQDVKVSPHGVEILSNY